MRFVYKYKLGLKRQIQVLFASYCDAEIFLYNTSVRQGADQKVKSKVANFADAPITTSYFIKSHTVKNVKNQIVLLFLFCCIKLLYAT